MNYRISHCFDNMENELYAFELSDILIEYILIYFIVHFFIKISNKLEMHYYKYITYVNCKEL